MPNPRSGTEKRSRELRIDQRTGIIIAFMIITAILLSGCSFSAQEFLDALDQMGPAQSKTSSVPITSEGNSNSFEETASADAPVTEPFTVVRVVDGDTIWVEDDQGKQYKVRIIGVDAPETEKEDQEGEPFAQEAFAFAKETLSDRVVYLEIDVSDTDQYGRLLRYVWLEEPLDANEDTFERLNFSAILIRGGYARVVAYGEDTRYETELRALEKLAREDHLGMWAYS